MKNVVRVTREELKIAAELGMSKEEYCRSKLQIEREQELKYALQKRCDQADGDSVYGEALARIEALEEAYDFLREAILARKRRAARLDVALDQADEILSGVWKK